MPSDSLTWLLWLLAATAALVACAAWLRNRMHAPVVDVPAPIESDQLLSRPAPTGLDPQWGREYKHGVGSAGIKSIVREACLEDAYRVRVQSDTAFEAYADFDRQQERIAVTNRPPGPPCIALSDTLQADSLLSEGLGNRPPAEVWALREEWMPPMSHFVDEAAFQLRARSVWPARITAHLSAGGHGLPGLFALFAIANEFPRADRHAHFIVPEGDVERVESIRLLDALRLGELHDGFGWQPLAWHARRPLAFTCLLRDNRRGREQLDEVAAHVAPALGARVRFETGTSENLSNLMRRLTKDAVRDELEPCPMTFHYASVPVPVARADGPPQIEVSTVMPLADAALRALRHGDGVSRALDVDLDRHLLLVTLPCNDWDEVRQVEAYVTQRLEFGGPRDQRCIGVYFSGYQPDPSAREEHVLAIRLGAVAGGWDPVYRAIAGVHATVKGVNQARVNGVVHEDGRSPAPAVEDVA